MSAICHWTGAAAAAAVRAREEAGLRAAAQLLLEAARERAPVDTGRLRASGSASAEGVRASVRFDAPYAAAVHERGSRFLAAACEDPGLRAQMCAALRREVECGWN